MWVVFIFSVFDFGDLYKISILIRMFMQFVHIDFSFIYFRLILISIKLNGNFIYYFSTKLLIIYVNFFIKKKLI